MNAGPQGIFPVEDSEPWTCTSFGIHYNDALTDLLPPELTKTLEDTIALLKRNAIRTTPNA